MNVNRPWQACKLLVHVLESWHYEVYNRHWRVCRPHRHFLAARMTPTGTSKSFQSPLEATVEANAWNTPSNGTRRALIGINTVPERSPTTSTAPESSHKSASIRFNGDIESSESSLVHKEDKAIRRLLESWMESLQLISVLVSL